MVNTDGSATFSSGAEPCTCEWCKPSCKAGDATSAGYVAPSLMGGYEYGPAAATGFASAGVTPSYKFIYPYVTSPSVDTTYSAPSWVPILSDTALARKVLRDIASNEETSSSYRILAARALLDPCLAV